MGDPLRYLEQQVGKAIRGECVRDLDEAFGGVRAEIARLRADNAELATVAQSRLRHLVTEVERHARAEVEIVHLRSAVDEARQEGYETAWKAVYQDLFARVLEPPTLCMSAEEIAERGAAYRLWLALEGLPIPARKGNADD
jgi:hypothetical protein